MQLMVKKKFQRFVDKIISSCITPSLRRQGVTAEPLMSKAARFVACEVVDGDYLEFGVYQGDSFIASYKHLEEAFKSRISLNDNATANSQRKTIWDNMRFFAFDSFQGLPVLETEDAGTLDFKKGMFACDAPTFLKNINSADVPVSRVHLVEGWFSDTCNTETLKEHNIKKASIIWIDGDLYSSARDVLNFVKDLLQDGTIIIFDDWFSYRGNPSYGEQRAFYEWIESPAIKCKFKFQEYARDSWKRTSFIVNTI